MNVRGNSGPVLGTLTIALLLVTNMMGMLGITSFTAEGADVNGSIVLDQNGFSVDGSGGEDFTVRSGGNVTVDTSGTGSSIQSVRVDLYIDAGGWQCNVTPETLYFNSSGGRQDFSWWVEIPSSSSPGTYTAEIDAMCYPEPGLFGQGLDSELVILEVVNGSVEPNEDLGMPLTFDGGVKSELRFHRGDIAWLGAAAGGGGGSGSDVFSTTPDGGSPRKLTGDSTLKWSLEVSDGRACYVDDGGGGISVVNLADGGVQDIEPGLQEGRDTVPQYRDSDIDGDLVSFIATESNDLADVNGEDSDVFVHEMSSNDTVRYSDTDPMDHNEQTYACSDEDYLLYSNEDGSLTLVDLHTGNIQYNSWGGLTGPLDMDDGIAVFVDEYSWYGDSDICIMELPDMNSLWGLGTWGDDHSPRIDNGRLVWCSGPVPSGTSKPVSGDIYYWDMFSWTFAEVTNGTGTNWCPDISGDELVCLSDRNSPGSGADVYKYHIAELDMNNPPVVNSIVSDPESIIPGGICVIEVDASDPDEDWLDYHYKVTGGTIQGYGNVVKWIAPDEEGEYTISVVASDGLAKSNLVNVTVEVDIDAPVDMAPVIDSLEVHPDAVEPGGAVEVTVTAHDENNDTLQYQYLCNGGEFGTDGALTSQDSDIWTAPHMEDVFTLQVRAFDGEYYSDPKEVRVTVSATPEPTPENHPPVIGDIQVEPREVRAGSTAVITVSASDEDGDELSYSFTAENGILAGQGSSVDWTAPYAEGNYRVTIVVRDIHDTSDSDHVDIRVYKDSEPGDGSDDTGDTDEPEYDPGDKDKDEGNSVPGFSGGSLLVAVLATLILFNRVGLGGSRTERKDDGGKARMKLIENVKGGARD